MAHQVNAIFKMLGQAQCLPHPSNDRTEDVAGSSLEITARLSAPRRPAMIGEQ